MNIKSKVNINCSWCGKNLELTHCEKLRYKDHFCSMDHRNLWLKEHGCYRRGQIFKHWEQSSESNKKRSEVMKGQNNLASWRRAEQTKNWYLTSTGKEKALRDSLRMKTGGAAYANSFIKNPSFPQIKLYKISSELFPNPVLNYPVYHPKNYSIDIAVPCLALAIEYDGLHFHLDREKDLLRQNDLEEQGWKFLRYSNLPSKESFLQDALGVLRN